MVRSPCFFNLTLNCEGGAATISGERQVYILVSPDRSPTVDKPVIVIKNVELK